MKTEISTEPQIARAMMNGKPVFTVPAKSVVNFSSDFKTKLLCDGPTFTAGTACVYNCTFCYVPTVYRKQKPWLAKHGVTGEHADIVIRRGNAVEICRAQLLGHSESERLKKKVIYSSPAVDVAGNMELVRETVEICSVILETTNWDIRLLSKSNLLPKVASLLEEEVPRWSRIFKPKERIIYGVSTGTLDDKLAQAFEQGCPLVSKRIQSLHWLQDNGFRTFGMICPSLPFENGWEYVVFARDMAAAIRADKCEHVWAEVINVRGKNFTDTHNALTSAGFNDEAYQLQFVSNDRTHWENYARQTFEAHSQVLVNQGKLRFLQYVTKDTRDWWSRRNESGAVICN